MCNISYYNNIIIVKSMVGDLSTVQSLCTCFLDTNLRLILWYIAACI